MKRASVLWTIAFIITLSSAVYQRLTGPTYPVTEENSLNGKEFSCNLPRSHGGNTDCEVSVTTQHQEIAAELSYKRYKTNDEWTSLEMIRNGDVLSGFLPHQPPAGKLMYKITLTEGNNSVTIPASNAIIIRFKGDVPGVILIPHVIFMFAAMLVSTRAGLEALFRKKDTVKHAYWSAGLLFIGGMIFGPLVQHYAFGELWTGFPFGYDLTDNKTLIAMVVWIAAVIACRRKNNPEKWIIFASAIQLVIFVIPHSVLGSELDYSKMPDTTL